MDYVKQLSFDDFADAWEAITVIEARDQLNKIDVACYPKSKKESREQMNRQLHEQAYPASFKEPVQMTNSGLAKLLAKGRG